MNNGIDVGSGGAPAEPVDAWAGAILEQLPVGTLVVDRWLTIIACNRRLERFLHLGRPLMLGRQVTELLDPEHGAVLQSALRRVLPWQGVVQLSPELRDGALLHVAFEPLDDVPRAGCMVGCFYDLTQQLLLHERQRYAEKMEALSQLAGGIAHSYNNKLAGIMGYAELVLRKSDSGSDVQGYAQRIINGTREAASATRKLLAFARQGQSRCEPLDLNAVLADVAEALRKELPESIRLRCEWGAELPCLMGHYGQLYEAFMQLAGNAIEAMPEGGELVINTSLQALRRKLPCITLDDTADGTYLQVTFTDTGCGMDSQTLHRAMEPFYTTKSTAESQGLGLAAAFGVAKKHGGSLHLGSRHGHGTTARFYLPPCVEATPTPARAPAGEVADVWRVLLVDDDELVRGALGEFLRSRGHTVREACDGREALAVYRAAGGAFDIIVLDMVMPHLNGAEVAQAIRRLNPAAPIILASGYGVRGDSLDLAELGSLEFMGKPFRPSSLEARMREMLATR